MFKANTPHAAKFNRWIGNDTWVSKFTGLIRRKYHVAQAMQLVHS